MLKELFDAVCGFCRENNKPVVIKEASDRDTVTLVINGVVSQEARTQYPRLVAQSLPSFVSMFHKEFGSYKGSSVFVATDGDEREVIGVISCVKHLGEVEMALESTAIFKSLAWISSNGKSLNQKQLIKFLKINLADAVSPDVVELFRKVHVQTVEQRRQEVQAGAVRGMQEFTKASETPPPEHIIVTTYCWVNGGETTQKTIRLAIELNFETSPATFDVNIVGDDLDAALSKAQKETMDTIAESLKILKSESPVYAGRPPLRAIYE